MKRYETYILKATEQIKAKLATSPTSYKVPEVYKGYIASFASSIRQSGLLAAVSFYTGKSTDNKSPDYRRNRLMQAIHVLVEGTEGELIELALKKTYGPNCLSNVPLRTTQGQQPNLDELSQLQTDIDNATLALKLALRSFNLENI